MGFDTDMLPDKEKELVLKQIAKKYKFLAFSFLFNFFNLLEAALVQLACTVCFVIDLPLF
jgi:hypothetical protein